MTQIDLEEAIAAKAPLTVGSFAKRNAVPEWRVRRSIELGTLNVDRRKRPMVITEGEVALSVQEWQRVLEPATKRIRPSVFGWSDGGRQLHVLDVEGHTHIFRMTLLKSSAEKQRREIDRLPVKRLGGAAA